MAAWKQPAAIALGLLAVLYIAVALTRPAGLFWSSNQGDKFMQVQALLDGRYDLSLAYPGRWLDPELRFRPYVLSYVWNGGIQVPWPMAWALPSALLYGLLGDRGLVVLPVIGGLLAAWGAGRLAEWLTPGAGWLAVVLAGLGTPLLVFSTLFWEHAPSAGAFMAGLLLWKFGRPNTTWRAAAAGLGFGLAVAWRNEAALHVVAVLAAGRLAGGYWPQRHLASLGAGLAIPLAPAATYNWWATGAVYVRTNAPPGSPERVVENLARYVWQFPADFLVGRADYGLVLPEAARWGPALGLALLLASCRLMGGRQRGFRLLGLGLAGSATAVLFVSPAPPELSGFLIAAPFLALALLLPPELLRQREGKALAIFGVLALGLYLVGSMLFHNRGAASGGTTWGARFLLPLYPPLAALAVVALRDQIARGRRWETLVGLTLVALGVGCQLAGLAQVDRSMNQSREHAQLMAGLPPGPIVIRRTFLVEITPGPIAEREIFCAETPTALRRWAERAAGAGLGEFWLVDWAWRGPLDGWLVPSASQPTILASASGGVLTATRFRTPDVAAAVRSEARQPATCGYTVAALN